MLGLVDPYRVEFCGGCGQGRLVPQLSQEELTRLYDGSYFDSAEGQAPADAEWRPPASDYASQVVPERLSKFAQALRDLRALHPRARTFLDVGAATGDMVKLARDAGFAADGLEFSQFAIRQARERHGIELMDVLLADLEAPARYDLVHLSHVFEHFNDPLAELKHLRRVLAPDGLLYIEVPMQFHSVARVRMRLRPVNPGLTVHSLHHPFFYTATTLRRLLQANGFEVVRTKVFDPGRYPARSVATRVKRVLWWLLSGIEIGNYIEVIARPAGRAR